LRTEDGAALLTFFDCSDGEDRLAGLREFASDFVSFIRGYDRYHADAAVEGSGHLFGLDISLGLQERHQAGLIPAVGIHARVKLLGQNAGDIFEKPAAGDVREGADAAAADDG
jgi:hypothetical protein